MRDESDLASLLHAEHRGLDVYRLGISANASLGGIESVIENVEAYVSIGLASQNFSVSRKLKLCHILLHRIYMRDTICFFLLSIGLVGR